jgi:hypothetical protein
MVPADDTKPQSFGKLPCRTDGKASHRPRRRHPAHIHLRLPYLVRYGPHGWVTMGPGAWNTGWHHGTGFFSGLPHRLSRRRSRALQSSARPSTPPGVTRSRSVRPTPASNASSRMHAHWSCAPRRAATSSGETLGSNVATTTLTKRQSTSSSRDAVLKIMPDWPSR